MCYHSKLTAEAKKIEKRFDAKMEYIHEYQPIAHINAFDFPKTPIITHTAPHLIQHFNWGLIPAWSKDTAIRQYTLNARIETIKEKPSFRNVVQQRCLILADGFYEWKWLDNTGKKKQKHLISLNDNEPYAYGGIYAEWIHPNTGEIRNTYSIVTTVANPLIAAIHRKKRMPIILNPADEKGWLQGQEIDVFAFPYSTELIAQPI